MSETISAEARAAALTLYNKMDSWKGPWVVHLNHFLPADVTTDYAGMTNFQNTLAESFQEYGSAIEQRHKEEVGKRAENVSPEEANELMDVLHTIVPTGRAFITSARELVRVNDSLRSQLREKDEQIAKLQKAYNDAEAANRSYRDQCHEIEKLREEVAEALVVQAGHLTDDRLFEQLSDVHRKLRESETEVARLCQERDEYQLKYEREGQDGANARSLVDALHADNERLTREREMMREHHLKSLESDSEFGSCDCDTKTPDIQYHKPGCKYRLIVQRDSLRTACLIVLESLKHDGFGMDDAEKAIRKALNPTTP